MDYDAHLKRKITFEEDDCKECADLWENCAKALKVKIEARSEFDSMAHRKQISLLKSIKEKSLSY